MQFVANYKDLLMSQDNTVLSNMHRMLSSSSTSSSGYMMITPPFFVFIVINLSLALIVYTGFMCMNNMTVVTPSSFIREDKRPPIGKES